MRGKIDPMYCKEDVPDGGRYVGFHQCSRKAVRDGYCNLHHPETVKSRRAVRDAQWAHESAVRSAGWAIKDREKEVVEAAVAWGEARERDGATENGLALAVGNLKEARAKLTDLQKVSA